jgi:hypothetical protein
MKKIGVFKKMLCGFMGVAVISMVPVPHLKAENSWNWKQGMLGLVGSGIALWIGYKVVSWFTQQGHDLKLKCQVIQKAYEHELTVIEGVFRDEQCRISAHDLHVLASAVRNATSMEAYLADIAQAIVSVSELMGDPKYELSQEQRNDLWELRTGLARLEHFINAHRPYFELCETMRGLEDLGVVCSKSRDERATIATLLEYALNNAQYYQATHVYKHAQSVLQALKVN